MLFFVYGQLCQGAARPVTVSGQLRVEPRGIDACARFDLPGVVRGQLRQFTPTQVLSLDRLEGRPPHVYKRVQIELPDGREAWAYQYASPDFWRFQVVRSGVWLPRK